MTEQPALAVAQPTMPLILDQLARRFTLHRIWEMDRAAVDKLAPSVRGIVAQGGVNVAIDRALIERFPHLEIVASLGVGYEHVDTTAAAARSVIVTNTPDVLTEEVADTALGLLLSTVRQLPQADRFVRDGRWGKEGFPLSESLRDRRVGLFGMGRIGRAIARRLEAFGVPVVYFSRKPNSEVSYRHYPDLVEMARDVDTLILIAPGGAGTRLRVNAQVLAALGPRGILINVARGTIVDEPALIEALKNRTILTAGLDVFADEPNVPAELRAMPNVVLFPHIGSASVYTRNAMGQLVVDNLLRWFEGKGPMTPVPETPWPRPGA